MPTIAAEPADGEPTTRKGLRLAARELALGFAEAQATDEDIEAAVRRVFCARGRKPRLYASDVAKCMEAWRDCLEDARVYGRCMAKKALAEVTKGGESVSAGAQTQAAARLLDRVEHVAGLTMDIDRLRRKLLKMSDEDLRAFVLQLAKELG